MDFKISSLGSHGQVQNADSFEDSLDLQLQKFAGSLEERGGYVMSTPYHKFNDSGYHSGQQDEDNATPGKRKYSFFDIDDFESSFTIKSPEKRFRENIADSIPSKYLSKFQDDFASDLQAYDFLSFERFLPVLPPPDLTKSSGNEVQFSSEVTERLSSKDNREPPSPEDRKSVTVALKSKSHFASKVFNFFPLLYKPVDFIKELQKRNCYGILSLIFRSLPIKDLISASNTCQDWKYAIENDRNATGRKKAYLKQRRMQHVAKKENLSVQPPLPKKEFRAGILRNVENQYSSNQKTNKITCDSNVPLLQVQSISTDPRLIVRKCPACSMACKFMKMETKAICKRVSCQHEFCVKCFGPYKEKHVCSVLNMEERENLQSVMCNKKSKKNLRRL